MAVQTSNNFEYSELELDLAHYIAAHALIGTADTTPVPDCVIKCAHGSILHEVVERVEKKLAELRPKRPSAAAIEYATHIVDDKGAQLEQVCLIYKPYEYSYIELFDSAANVKRTFVKELLAGAFPSPFGKVCVSPIANPIIDLTAFFTDDKYTYNEQLEETPNIELVHRLFMERARRLTILAFAIMNS